MRPEPTRKIHRKALTVWRISSSINAFVFLAIIVGLFVVLIRNDWPMWPAYIGTGLFILYAILNIWLLPAMRWKRWRYDVHEHEIDLQRGIFVKERTLVPMVRVQHVDTRQGPILKRYKLSTVIISTAATIHEIPALGEEEADQVRDYISKLARVTDDDDI
ncbi:MAG: PH domain-containing protein [Bacillaceae bacterium]|nr:PH domain-containing protein [Bacillaceae bacterium]